MEILDDDDKLLPVETAFADILAAKWIKQEEVTLSILDSSASGSSSIDLIDIDRLSPDPVYLWPDDYYICEVVDGFKMLDLLHKMGTLKGAAFHLVYLQDEFLVTKFQEHHGHWTEAPLQL